MGTARDATDKHGVNACCRDSKLKFGCRHIDKKSEGCRDTAQVAEIPPEMIVFKAKQYSHVLMCLREEFIDNCKHWQAETEALMPRAAPNVQES